MFICIFMRLLVFDSFINFITLRVKMSSKEDRLFFYSKDPDAAEKTLGKTKPLHPHSLLPPESQPMQAQPQQPDPIQGKFVNDHLLAEQDPPVKGKRISKPDKRVFYKTKMCPFGLECKKRLMSCQYAHCEQQRRKPFKNRKNPCKLYQLGKCQLGAACSDYHGNMDLKKKNYQYKKSVCKDFVEGKCSKGYKICIYVHPGEEEIEGEVQGLQEFLAMQEGKIEEEVVEEVGEEVKKQEAMKMSDDAIMKVQNDAIMKVQNEALQQKKSKKDIIEVLQSKIGEQQLVPDGLSFNFTF